MKKLIQTALTAVLVLLILAPISPCSAQSSSTSSSLYADYPAPLSVENPYASALARARSQLDASIASFWSVYYSRPYDYWATIDAYYAYVNAYYGYRWYLDAYLRHERAQLSFAGFVKTRDPEPGQVIPMIYPYPGHAVAGARVTLATYVPPGQGRPVQLIGVRTTDASGAFRFSGLRAGTYSYSVAKEGFADDSGTVEVNGAVTRTLFIARSRALTGTVRTPQLFGTPPPDWNTGRYAPRPVGGATVSVTILDLQAGGAPVTRRMTTGFDGKFRFDGLPGSAVRLEVAREDFRTSSQVVNLGAGTTDVDVLLQSSLPPPPVAGGGPLGQETVTPGSDLNNPFGRD